MKIVKGKNRNIFLLHPTFETYREDWFSGGRKSFIFTATTGFKYLKESEDLGAWFEITILGFGFGFYWNFEGKEW